eukprot:gene8001-9846_t
MPTTIYEGVPSAPTNIVTLKTAITRKYQYLIEKTITYLPHRWAFVAFYLLGGWYVVTYALGIYLLTLFIAFLSPKYDPELEDDVGGSLPTTRNKDDDVKPFVRRLPEFQFWYKISRAFVIAIFCTFFPFLNLPVFWPILLLYFIVVFTVTMKNQIRHMIKHKYLPFTVGKKVYSRSND